MLPGLRLIETMQFVCTHITPELTRARREWQLHPGGATAVAEVIIAAEVVAAQTAQLAPASLSNSKITIMTKPDVEKRFGTKALAGAPANGIIALKIRVNEPDAAGAMLSMGRVPHEESRHGIIVPASAAHGVVLEFAED